MPISDADRHALEAQARPDEAIDFSDAPELPAEAWARATVVVPDPTTPKQPISIRLDADVLAWFKQQGRGYQTRINRVLRRYMRHHTKNTSP